MKALKALTARYRKAKAKVRHHQAKTRKFKANRVTYRTHYKQVREDLFTAVVRMNEAERALAEAKTGSANEAKIQKLTEALAKASLEHDEATSRVVISKKKFKKANHGVKHHAARLRWWLKRKTTLRKKLKAAKQKAFPKYESWMANGYDDSVTPAVKAFVARGVVQYDLYVTSMRRTYVPPGGSTTSYHLAYPGKAADLGGARMAEFQIAEWKKQQGNSNCLELFGPDNNACLKYGVSMSMPEGSALESLHDTHVHGAFN